MTLYNGCGKILPKTHHLTFPSSKNNLELPKNLIELTVNSADLTAVGSFITILGKDALHQWDLEQRRVLEGQTCGNTVTPFGWVAPGDIDEIHVLYKYARTLFYDVLWHYNYDIGYDMAIWYLVIYTCSRYMFEVTQAALHDRWLTSYRISVHMYLNWWPVLYMTQQQGEERSNGVSWVMSIHDQQIQWSHLSSIKLTMSEPTPYIWNTNRFFVACEFMLNFYLHNLHCQSSQTTSRQNILAPCFWEPWVIFFVSERFGQIWW